MKKKEEYKKDRNEKDQRKVLQQSLLSRKDNGLIGAIMGRCMGPGGSVGRMWTHIWTATNFWMSRGGGREKVKGVKGDGRESRERSGGVGRGGGRGRIIRFQNKNGKEKERRKIKKGSTGAKRDSSAEATHKRVGATTVQAGK